MKIGGKVLTSRVTKNVTIRNGDDNGAEPLVVTISAMPLGIEERAMKLFPLPEPPIKFAQNKAGLVLRDSKTGKPIKHKDDTDQEYLTLLRKQSWCHALFYFYHAVKNDPEIEFDVSSRNDISENDAAFYAEIEKELREAGFTTGEINHVMRAAMDLSTVRAADVEEEAELF